MPSPRKPIILDGGFSRELIRLGAPFAQPEWSALSLLAGASGHKCVAQAHTAFARAGAEVLTTNSYALVPFHIGEERFRERGRELAETAGRLVREVADGENGQRRSGESGGRQDLGRVRVAGSLPPVFGSYEPELFDGTRVQEYLAVLVGAMAPYVDLWLGETMSLIAEAEAVRVAVKGSGKPVWIAFTLDDRTVKPGEAGAKLRSGESVAEAAAKVVRWEDVEAILFNCSRPEYMLAAVKDTKAVFDEQGCKKLIGVYANRFEPQGDEYKANSGISTLRDDLGEGEYIKFARSWVEAGAEIVGGCCGVGSEHIEKLANEFSGDKPSEAGEGLGR